MGSTLYICYFGVRESLVQTQVIPYLRELDKGEKWKSGKVEKSGVAVSLLTFEPDFKAKWTAEQIAETRRELAAVGIDWHYLPYHKRPSGPATAWDIFRGTIRVWRLNRKEKFDVLHCRVHVPGMMAGSARKFSRHKPKMLFDIRGFFPEEFVDGGLWPANGILYRSAKRAEKWLMKEADGFVVLTEKAREILFPESAETGRDKLGRPVEVIPCCVDLDRIKVDENIREKLGIGDRFVVTYVGSFGGWYLTDEMMKFFAAAREFRSDVFVLILTQRDKEMIAERLRSMGFSENDFFVESVRPHEIANYVAAADVALSFIKACYSKLSSSPTKLAEYLACGVPVIANRGVGDVDKLIEENGVGILLDDLSRESYLKALSELGKLGNVAEKCRETAAREFDLESVGGKRYRRMYKRLVG